MRNALEDFSEQLFHRRENNNGNNEEDDSSSNNDETLWKQDFYTCLNECVAFFDRVGIETLLEGN